MARRSTPAPMRCQRCLPSRHPGPTATPARPTATPGRVPAAARPARRRSRHTRRRRRDLLQRHATPVGIFHQLGPVGRLDQQPRRHRFAAQLAHLVRHPHGILCPHRQRLQRSQRRHGLVARAVRRRRVVRPARQFRHRDPPRDVDPRRQVGRARVGHGLRRRRQRAPGAAASLSFNCRSARFSCRLSRACASAICPASATDIDSSFARRSIGGGSDAHPTSPTNITAEMSCTRMGRIVPPADPPPRAADSTRALR